MGAIAMIVLFLLLISAAFTWFCGHLSHKRGHGWMLGLVLGFFLGLIGLIIILVMSPRRAATRRTRRPVRGGTRTMRGSAGGQRQSASRIHGTRSGSRQAGARTTERYAR